MKKVYIYHCFGVPVRYFSTLKKLHKYLLENNIPVFRHFSEFKRWFEPNWHTAINEGERQEYCTAVNVF